MFFKKHDDMKKDIREIKENIEEHEEIPLQDLIDHAPKYPSFEPRQEPSAPLFVKVEKYREVVSSIQELKLFVASVKDVFNTLQEIETLRSDALNMMKVTIQRLEKVAVEMDSELLRPRGVSIASFSQGEKEVKHIESSLTELQKQILELKHELQGMK